MLDHGRGDRVAVLGDRAHRGRLVVAHEAAVALHVGAQDGGQLAGYGTSVHRSEVLWQGVQRPWKAAAWSWANVSKV
jgi:hypothetical protein